MFRIFTAIAGAMAALIVRCATEPQPSTIGAAAGSIAIPLTAPAGAPVSGTAALVLDTVSSVVDVNGSAGSDGTVAVTCLFGAVERGRRALVCIADLTVNGIDTVAAGYAMIDIAAGETAALDGLLFTPMAVGQTATGAPQFTHLAADAQSSTTSAVNISVTGIAANMDADRVFIYVNDDAFPVILVQTTGTASFVGSVILEAGVNTIRAVAVNSTGMAGVSEARSVRYAPPVAAKRSMSATLLWDSPSGNLDLHLWYYASPNPALPSQANEHCEFEQRNISIKPDAGNLLVYNEIGQGPEFMTCADFPDGYYVFAVNCFDLKGQPVIRGDLTLSAPSMQRTVRHAFTASNFGDYATGLDAWFRSYDIRVSKGRAELLSPDPAFQYHALQ